MSEAERYDFTARAWETVYDVVDSELFMDSDAELIYSTLANRLKIVSFGDYLKRYIHRKAVIEEDFKNVPLRDYQHIICEAFKDNQTRRLFSLPRLSSVRLPKTGSRSKLFTGR